MPQQAGFASEGITKQVEGVGKWEGLGSGGVLGGNGNGSSVNNAGSNGYYWSSTYNNTNNAYNLNFNSSGVNPQNNNNKYNGFAVRCVKNWEDVESLFSRKQ